MQAIIFLGPSLPLSEAKQILPAVYLPPAQQADLISAIARYQPDAIGLIDGVFYQALSVWHKEILYALDQGIAVYGASSMGALRAAETAAFGMVGVGKVYHMYASGELTDDDEVALAHGPASDGYRKVSEPMVNIRATLAAAERAGVIAPSQHSQLIAIAKAMHFPERTFSAILKRAAIEGFPETAAQILARFVAGNYVDVKKQDAIELLTTIRDLQPDTRPSSPKNKAFQFNRSGLFETLYNRDRSVEHENINVPLESVANYAALHHPAFEELNFSALNRVIVDMLAKVLEVQSNSDEIEAEVARFRRKQGVVEEEAFAAWLRTNHLNQEEFRQLMSQLANCRRLHRWFMMARWAGRTTKVVLDELRLNGQYVDWLTQAATQQRLLEDQEDEAAEDPLDVLVQEHLAWTECKISTDWPTWAEEAGFHDATEFKNALARAKSARQTLLELLAASREDSLANGNPA